jgi:hypothetical protein
LRQNSLVGCGRIRNNKVITEGENSYNDMRDCKLELEHLAKVAGYSVPHFYRVFGAIVRGHSLNILAGAQSQQLIPPDALSISKSTEAPKRNSGQNVLIIVLSVLLVIQIVAVILFGWPGFIV